MATLNRKKIQILSLVSMLAVLPLVNSSAAGAKSNEQPLLIAAKTEQFKMKQGFERKPKDIIIQLQ